MILKKWEDFPEEMKNEYVKKYYDQISNKKVSLISKRLFDILVSLLILIILLPIMILISIIIKIDSNGPIFFKQKRVTQYGRIFYILKFRTMKVNSESYGHLTCKNDPRVTKVGFFLRKFKIDEFPQLINILLGDMTFVGTRPEVPEYVEQYTDEMLSTLILPAGVTSISCIEFRDESKYLLNVSDANRVYLNDILPKKMKYNIEYLNDFNIFTDIKIMILTFLKTFKFMR